VPNTLYWDANVFLSYIEGRDDRCPHIEAILDDCDNGRIEIWTSQLSVAEVAFAKTEKDARVLDAETEKAIDDLWHPESPIKLAEVGYGICQEAKKLLRKNLLRPQVSPRQLNKSLKASDAIHLATAQLIGVDEFHTYDLLKEFECLVSFKIGNPISNTPLLPSVRPPKQLPTEGEQKPDQTINEPEPEN
jgi:predicted nucleic acid-binding protein